MRAIRKSVVSDESMRPIAVQIPYSDWLEIERQLGLGREGGDREATTSGNRTPGVDPIADAQGILNGTSVSISQFTELKRIEKELER